MWVPVGRRLKVMLVDGELPDPLLQNRLQDLVGRCPHAELLRVRSLAVVKNRMPALSDPKAQEEFFLQVTKGWRPDVIIFDTRTAIFKHDTNNAEQLLTANEFLTRPRAEGFAVILAHHAGKNNTTRGRTDNDDITDLIMQLNKRPGWQPGTGLEFLLAFEKVRYGNRLEGFEAKYKDGTWQRLDHTAEVIQALLQARIDQARIDRGGCGGVRARQIQGAADWRRG